MPPTTWMSEVPGSKQVVVEIFYFVKFRFFVSSETPFYPKHDAIALQLHSLYVCMYVFPYFTSVHLQMTVTFLKPSI